MTIYFLIKERPCRRTHCTIITNLKGNVTVLEEKLDGREAVQCAGTNNARTLRELTVNIHRSV